MYLYNLNVKISINFTKIFVKISLEISNNIYIPFFPVPQPDYASPGETYYVSLMRENLQVRMGDTVYVLRAFKSPPTPELVTTSPTSGSGKSSKPEEQTSFNQGGIKHKMMSPLKGPSQEASTLTKGVRI